MATRIIDTEVWNDPKFTDDFTAEDKYFWLFILTTRYGNLSGTFEITFNQIAKDMGYSKETAANLIYRFVNIHKMVEYDYDTNEILIFNWYKYNWNKSPKMETHVFKFVDKLKSDYLKNMITEMYEEYKNYDRVSIPFRYPSISISNTNSNNLLNIKEKEEKNSNDIKYIINYLNEKTNKNFKHTTAKTKSLINARLNDGFTLEDFKRVIDVKTADWLNDEKWSRYLQPETLFSNKFEGYLNQEMPKKKEDKFSEYVGNVL